MTHATWIGAARRLALFLLPILPVSAHADTELSGIASIAAGGLHTCALTAGGAVRCWGRLPFGTNGAYINALVPMDAPGMQSGVRAIAAGGGGTCALMDSGAVECFGSIPGYVPASPTEVAAISVGGGHACVLTSAGGVKCWGANTQGQLGNGTTTASTSPVNVAGLASGVTAVSAGASHTCASMAGGGVKCWGANTYDYYSGGFTYHLVSGALGAGDIPDQWSPVDVVGLTEAVVALSAAYRNTCAVTASGAAKCWGQGYGYLPADVAGLASGAVAIASSGAHACVLSGAGGVKCWGANLFGELGDGTASDLGRLDVDDVSGLASGVAAVVVGTSHSCALMLAGGVRCWGANESGELGDATTSASQPVRQPRDVVGLSGPVTQLSAGNSHSCARTASGAAQCWGSNEFLFQVYRGVPQYSASGAIGDGTYRVRAAPVTVAGLASGVAGVSAGTWHSCAAMSAGGAKCWGYSEFLLGDGGDQISSPVPVNVSGLSNVAAVAAGGARTCALLSDQTAKCWGSGPLGDTTTAGSKTPVSVTGLAAAVRIASGRAHSCAVTAAGSLQCWGSNYSGQIGDGTTTDRLAITPVSSVRGTVASVATGGAHTCALLSGGGVQCWGANSRGQLGVGSRQSHSLPSDVFGLSSGVVALSAGSEHTCAITYTGGVKCWGANAYGQLGDGTTADRLVPVDVPGLSGAIAVAAGGDHTCALISGGAVRCWGLNDRGQLGVGSVDDLFMRPLPAPVVSGTGVAITLAATGTGFGFLSMPDIACSGVCVTTVAPGATLTLTPSTFSGQYAFTGWGGACAGTGACTVTANAPASVTANFRPASELPRLSNLSTRGKVGAGEDVLIAGFIVEGSLPKHVVINVAGPSLVNSGIPNPLANPALTLVRSADGAIIATNDDWQAQANPDDVSTIQGSGFQPNHTLEPALYATLDPGAYTAIVSGRGEGGVAVVGVFEVDYPDVPLVNISTRGKVLTGGDVMIAGFIVGGTSGKTVVVNVAGPSLANFGVASPLQNPTLTLVRSSDNAVIATNDDWQTQANPADVTAIDNSGFKPNNALEPAIIATLPPGAYTAIVSGVGGGTGIALVGVFVVP
jgi:alpha-tubulin suppressor-like RCC1 family protein